MTKKFLIIGEVIISLFYSSIFAENIAKEKQVVGTFSEMEKAVDGSTTTYAEAKVEKDREQYIILVLGEPRYIEKIVIYWNKDYYATRYKIDTSIDFVSWKILKNNQDASKFPVVGNCFYNVHQLKGESGLFVRITINKANKDRVRISEIEIYPKSDITFQFIQVGVQNIKEHSADLYFTTDVETTGSLRIGLSYNEMKDGPIDLTFAKEHRIEILGLLKGTRYLVYPIARDANGNTKIGKSVEFKTAGIPLPLFENIEVLGITKTSAILQWISNVDTKFVLRYGLDMNISENIASSVFKKKNRVKISGLMPDTDCYYEIELIDAFGNKKISELRRFTSAENNIAFGKKVEGTFNLAGDNLGPVQSDIAINKLVDGDVEYFTGSVMSGVVMRSPQYFIIDLGAEQSIDRVVIFWWKLCYSRDYRIEVSNDKTSWKLIRDKINADSGKGVLSPGGNPMMVMETLCGGIKARYIRCYIEPGSEYYQEFPQFITLRIMEVKVFPVKGSGLAKISAEIIN